MLLCMSQTSQTPSLHIALTADRVEVTRNGQPIARVVRYPVPPYAEAKVVDYWRPVYQGKAGSLCLSWADALLWVHQQMGIES